MPRNLSPAVLAAIAAPQKSMALFLELVFVTNTTGVTPPPPSVMGWQANHLYELYNFVQDASGNLQLARFQSASGPTAPAFSEVIGTFVSGSGAGESWMCMGPIGAWAPVTQLPANCVILDPNGNLQWQSQDPPNFYTQSAQPIWATLIGQNTYDGQFPGGAACPRWTCLGPPGGSTFSATAGAGTNGSGSGVPWLNPGAVTGSTGFAILNLAASQTAAPLLATGFALNASGQPYGVIVLANTMQVIASGEPALMYLQLTYLGKPIGTPKPLPISSFNANHFFGGAEDTWGAVLTLAMVNDPSFGVAVIASTPAGTTLYGQAVDFQMIVNAGTGTGGSGGNFGETTETLWLWSGLGSIAGAGPAWDPAATFPYGTSFTGLGWMGRIESVPQNSELTAENMTLQLSGIPVALLSDVVNSVRLGGSAALWLGFFSDGQLLADPLQLWDGELDVPTVSDGAETCTVSITVENSLLALNLASNRRFTSLDQQLDYPGDSGFDYVSAMQDLYLPYPCGITAGSNISGTNLSDAPSVSSGLTIAPNGPQLLAIGGILSIVGTAFFVTGPYSSSNPNASTRVVTSVGLWSSSDVGVATVTNGNGANLQNGNFGTGGGVITAIGPGNCTITFFFGTVSCSLTVTVTALG